VEVVHCRRLDRRGCRALVRPMAQRFEFSVDAPHKTVFRLQAQTGDIDVFVLKSNGQGGVSLVSAEEYYPY